MTSLESGREQAARRGVLIFCFLLCAIVFAIIVIWGLMSPAEPATAGNCTPTAGSAFRGTCPGSTGILPRPSAQVTPPVTPPTVSNPRPAGVYISVGPVLMLDLIMSEPDPAIDVDPEKAANEIICAVLGRMQDQGQETPAFPVVWQVSKVYKTPPEITGGFIRACPAWKKPR